MTKDELLTFYRDDILDDYYRQRNIDVIDEIVSNRKKRTSYWRSRLYQLQEALDNTNKRFVNASPEAVEILYQAITDPIKDEIKRIRYMLYPMSSSKDLDKIKAIDIRQILSKYNVKITNSYGNRLRFSIRKEKIPSCTAYLDQNTWWDYGTNQGGSVIDLVMAIEHCSFKEAVKKLC